MNRKTAVGVVICLVLIVLTISMIWGFSLQPAHDSQVTSSFISSWLYAFLGLESIVDSEVFYHLVRKLAHMTEFALLALESASLTWLLLSHKARPMLWRHAVYPLAFGVIIATIDEIIQLFTPGRVGAIKDVCIDTLGTLLGILCIYFSYWLGRQHLLRKK